MNEAFAQLAAGAAGASSLAELGAFTLAPLRRLTGAAHALLYAYEERGVMVGLSGDDWIAETYRPYWAQDPTQHETARLRRRPCVALADRLVERQRLRQSRAYLEFYRPCEIEHLCCVFLTGAAHGSPGMTNVFLARGPKQEPYQDRELSLLEDVVPILSAAVERLRRVPSPGALHGEQALLDWGRRQPLLALSLDGRLDWVSPAACALLGEAVPARLPGSLTARLERLRTNVGERWGVPASPAHWRLPDGRLLRVDLSPTSDGDARARVIALLSPVAPPSPRRGDRGHTLSPSERHVMECLAAGSSTTEIASILSRSPATVRTHLRNIFAKLRVRSRTEAVLRWQAYDDRR